MIKMRAKLYSLYVDLLDMQKEIELRIEEPDSNKMQLYPSLRRSDEAVTILKDLLLEGEDLEGNRSYD